MSFSSQQAKFRRLFREHAAIRLLRADNAPHILAFLGEIFAQESEIPYGRARTLLSAALEKAADLGTWETETGAASYLSQWIKQGWLREMDDHVLKTDVCDQALRFVRGLDDRAAGTTASHLRIVQEAVRDLSVAMSPKVEDRIAVLRQQQRDLQSQIDALSAGDVPILSQAQQRERMKEVYSLASVLTSDFRLVEDDIRKMDKALRVEMIEGDTSRGGVLLKAMEQEDFLAKTEAGSAFESFFQLLCDDTRTTEFREQLRAIMSLPIAEHLSPYQHKFLGHLMRELNKESDRVFRVRRRTEEGLRAYVETGLAAENRAVDRLIAQVERVGLQLAKQDIELSEKTGLVLDHGSVVVQSPDRWQLKNPDERLDTEFAPPSLKDAEPSDAMLDCLAAIQVRVVAERIRQSLHEHGPLTLGGLIEHNPVTSGLEELVAFVRVAKAVNASLLLGGEVTSFTDRDGARFSATLPKYVLTEALFPDDLGLIAF